MLHRNPLRVPEGTRVRAVNFWIDEGLRIWPVDAGANLWRVVRVADQEVKEELFRGGQTECREKFPDARFGINDNEGVPPGTLGVVRHADEANLSVAWESGHTLGVTDRDTIERADLAELYHDALTRAEREIFFRRPSAAQDIIREALRAGGDPSY